MLVASPQAQRYKELAKASGVEMLGCLFGVGTVTAVEIFVSH